MISLDEVVKASREALERGEATAAYSSLLRIAAYPGRELENTADAKRVLELLTEIVRIIAGDALADAVGAAALEPNNPEVLFNAAYHLYEQEQYSIAGTLLVRAERFAPGSPQIISELALCLESMLRNREAAELVDAAPDIDSDETLIYLSGFNWFMSGDVETARKRIAQLSEAEDESVCTMRTSLARMVERADAIVAAGVGLEDRGLTAWHAVINCSVLLHESPHGYDDPMHGRYAFLNDSAALMREGLDRLPDVLRALGRAPLRVVSAPDRASRILARAAAKLLDLPIAPGGPGDGGEELIVAWTLEQTRDIDFIKAIYRAEPGQTLFVHASNWVAPFQFSPDITTLLYQTITHPWTGGALKIDPETKQVYQSSEDLRDDSVLADEILVATLEQTSASKLEKVTAVASAIAPYMPKGELRPLQRAGGPGFLRRLGHADRFGGIVRAGPGHDLDFARGFLTDERHDAFVFVVGQCRRFAGGPARGQAIGALFDVPGDEVTQGGPVDLAVLERRHDGHSHRTWDHHSWDHHSWDRRYPWASRRRLL